MNLLAIVGSPRKGKATDTLVDKAIEGVKSKSANCHIKKLHLIEKNIQFCRNCLACRESKTENPIAECAIRDDMDDIYPKLLEADGIIVASPIFFYALSAQLKALIDRCQALWARKYVLKHNLSASVRKGVFIGVGATRGEKLFDGSILTVRYFFKAIGVDYAGELLVRGVDKRGEIKERPSALADAFELGRKLAQEIASQR